VQLALDIENKVNDSIDPRPSFTIDIRDGDVVALVVAPGTDCPYCFRSRPYVRHDSSTVPADNFELRRLALRGSNLTYDELPASETDLTFTALERVLKASMGLESLTPEALKSFNLVDASGSYTVAASILADKNNLHAEGMDIARLGSQDGMYLDRRRVVGESAIVQYEAALEMFERYYRYEYVEGGYRQTRERIPYEAYREAVANAIAHRAWDVSCCVRISMHDDRIEVFAPGGLTRGMTEERYFENLPGVLRNRTLAGVLLRAGIIENYGAGVGRILQLYAGASVQPGFEFKPDAIIVTLPVTDGEARRSEEQEAVLSNLSRARAKGRKEILASVSFGKDKTVRILNELIDLGAVRKEGVGRATKYRKA
jgi:ATP-dependent DNA helicase RecG